MRADRNMSAAALWRLRLSVFAFVGSFFLLRLGAGALWDNSETTYGEIVKELFRTGDWLTLHFNFHPWSIHPPLWFWTTAASVWVLGLNEFALRLPSALFGLLSAYAVYAAARRLYGETAGLIAVLASAGSLEWVMLSRIAIQDTMLLFFMTLSTLWIYFALRDGDRKAFWVAVVAAALGTLTKGPIALILPLLVVIAFLLWTKAALHARELPWWWGATAYVAIASSWFVAAGIVHGTGFLSYYFGVSNVGRFLSPFENQPGPFWYYLPILVAGFFPYIAFVPTAIVAAWKSRDAGARYLLLSVAVPFVFFSIAQTKLPNYIALVFPSLGILVGRLFQDALSRNDVRALRGALLVLPASLLLLAAIIVVYGKLEVPAAFASLEPSLALLAWFVLPPAVATFVVTYVWKRVWVAPAGLAVMMGGFTYACIFSILPRAEAFKPMKAMAATVMSFYQPGDKIGTAGLPGGISLLFYTNGGEVTWVGDAEFDKRPKDFFAQQARVLCVVRPQDFRDFQDQGVRMWVLRRTRNLWLVTNKPPSG